MKEFFENVFIYLVIALAVIMSLYIAFIGVMLISTIVYNFWYIIWRVLVGFIILCVVVGIISGIYDLIKRD
jgi:hypothetical protein